MRQMQRVTLTQQVEEGRSAMQPATCALFLAAAAFMLQPGPVFVCLLSRSMYPANTIVAYRAYAY
jgi:hypothetical protein